MSSNTNNTLQAFWVMFGSLAGFIFVTASAMLLSRYFSKVDYGTFKQVTYIYHTLLAVFTLGLPKAYSYFLPRVPKSHAKDVIGKINYILIACGVVFSLIIFFGSDLIAFLLKNPALSSLLKWFSLVPLFMVPTMGLEGILATYKKTKILAFYNISTKGLLFLCITLPVVFFNGEVKHAIIGFTVGSFISFLIAMILKYYPVKHEAKEKSSYTYNNLFKYSLPIMLASIWGMVIVSSDQFFISRYFGSEVFAEFSNGATKIPFVGMIVGAISIVLAPIYSKLAKDESSVSKNEIFRLLKTVFEKTIKLVFPVVTFFFCFSDIIMVVLYGDQYKMSGVYFSIKILENYFTLLTFAALILSIGGQRFYYKVHMYGALILVFLEYVSIYVINSPFAIVWVSTIFTILKVFVLLSYISNYLKVRVVNLFPLKLILKILPISFLIIYGIRYILESSFQIDNVLLLLTSSIFYVLLFGLWSYFIKLDYYSLISPLLNKFNKHNLKK